MCDHGAELQDDRRGKIGAGVNSQTPACSLLGAARLALRFRVRCKPGVRAPSGHLNGKQNAVSSTLVLNRLSFLLLLLLLLLLLITLFCVSLFIITICNLSYLYILSKRDKLSIYL